MAKAYTEVQQTFTVDNHRAKLDGVSITAEADSWGVGDYTMPQDLHLNEAHVQWSGCFPGDYGYTCLLHPGGDSTTTADASSGADRIEVGASQAPYYDPSQGATDIEIWSPDESTLLEIHPILSVSGQEVIFNGTTLLAERLTGHKTKVRYGAFSPCRGGGTYRGGSPIPRKRREVLSPAGLLDDRSPPRRDGSLFQGPDHLRRRDPPGDRGLPLPGAVGGDMRERSPHRCGPGFFPEWVRRVLSIPFNESCAAHDEAYEEGVWPQEDIDSQFLEDMLSQAGRNPFLWLLAHAYYLMARLGGHLRYQSYRDGENG